MTLSSRLVRSYRKVKLLKSAKLSLKDVIVLVGLVVLLLIVIKQFDDFRGAIAAIAGANRQMLLLAAVASACTYLAAAMVFKLIAIRHLPYLRTLLVQTASSFTNRLLPAGTGAIATFTRYLIKQKHTPEQATTLVSLNSALGFVGLMILTITAAVHSRTPLSQAIQLRLPTWAKWLVMAAAVGLAVAALSNRSNRQQARKAVRGVLAGLRLVAARPLRLVLALIASMLITLSYAAVLYASIRAFGASATFLDTLIALTIGVGAATITPTPGGIGGAEAGLVAGLASVGIPADIGLSVALIFRLMTFWLPIIPGLIAFQFALKRNLL